MERVKKLARILKSPYYRTRLLRHRVAAGVEHAKVLSGLDCRTVVDIGANRGQFALVARQCLPHARVISFEPLPAAAAKFRAVFADDDRVTLHEVAIGPVPGNATIHISTRDDSSSLLPITATQVALFPGTAEVATATVRVAPLREFILVPDILPPALLKLDVQGFRAGGAPRLRRHAGPICLRVRGMLLRGVVRRAGVGGRGDRLAARARVSGSAGCTTWTMTAAGARSRPISCLHVDLPATDDSRDGPEIVVCVS